MIFEMADKRSNNDHPVIKTMKSELLDAMEVKWKARMTTLHFMASLLIGVKLKDEEIARWQHEFQEAKEEIENLWKQIEEAEKNEEEIEPKLSDDKPVMIEKQEAFVNTFMTRFIEKKDLVVNEEKKDEDFKVEFMRYLTTEAIDDNDYYQTCVNPLRVWNSKHVLKKKTGFPRVRQVALRVLSIAVASVEPETLFSDLKFTVTSRQSRMKPKHVNARICLKRWRLSKILPASTFEPKRPSKLRKFKVKKIE